MGALLVATVSFFVGSVLFQVSFLPVKFDSYYWVKVHNSCNTSDMCWWSQTFHFQQGLSTFGIFYNAADTNVYFKSITGSDGSLGIIYNWTQGNDWELYVGVWMGG